jgi:hypothetical protein
MRNLLLKAALVLGLMVTPLLTTPAAAQSASPQDCFMQIITYGYPVTQDCQVLYNVPGFLDAALAWYAQNYWLIFGPNVPFWSWQGTAS